MKVIGYSQQLSVFPTEQVDFHVSCDTENYQADIVRLIHGDTNPDGPGFKIEEVSTNIDGTYPGEVQNVYSGSHILIDDSAKFHLSSTFTLQAMVCPTTPEAGVQGILTKWDAKHEAGYGLMVGEDGCAQAWIGDGQGQTVKLTSDKPLLQGTWYLLAATFDDDGTLTLTQQPYVTSTNGRFTLATSFESTTATVTKTSTIKPQADNDVPVVLAGHVSQLTDEPIGVIVEGHFNGKIDRPRVHSTALNAAEIFEQIQRPWGQQLVAAWNFQEEITHKGIQATRHITDVSPNRLHGHLINLPMRAVTGYNWDSHEQNFIHAPDQYGAIHFHETDLDDARWRINFTLTVPDDLPSGVYAARLTADDDTDYVPFYVRAPRGQENKICFLVPTASYMAYANDHVSLTAPIAQLMIARAPVMEQQNIVLSKHREFGLSTYDHHSDQSGVAYSTRLRPILNMRPGFRHWLSPSLWQFNADLHLVDWLTTLDYDFDVVTDEDLHHEGVSALDPYRVVITGSHPEYYSGEMLDAVESHTHNGGRLMYMGANGFYWIINYDPENRNIIETRKGHGSQGWRSEPGEFHLSFTGEYGTIWRHRGRAPQRLVGVGWGSQGFDESSYYRVTPEAEKYAAWMFEGIDTTKKIGDFGLVGEGAAGLELDFYDAALGTPPETVIAANSESHTDVMLELLEDQSFNSPGLSGTQSGNVRADITYVPTPNGGGIWSTSSIAYCGSLSHNEYDNNISKLTQNVLDRFLSDEPAPPGVSSTQQN